MLPIKYFLVSSKFLNYVFFNQIFHKVVIYSFGTVYYSFTLLKTIIFNIPIDSSSLNIFSSLLWHLSQVIEITNVSSILITLNALNRLFHHHFFSIFKNTFEGWIAINDKVLMPLGLTAAASVHPL